MRFKITFFCLALAAVIAVGCGSSGSSSSGGGGSSATESSSATTSGDTSTSGDSGDAPLSKTEFISKGDAICGQVPQEYEAKVKEMEEDAKKKKKPQPSEVEKNETAAIPPIYVAASALEELPAPKGDEKQVEAIIAAMESAAKGLEQKPGSELSGPKSPFAEFQKLTAAYGFKGCSQL